jgi:multidrug efflux pump subunit AcrA (membrane-fusion protein)
VSTGSESQINPKLIEETRRQINRLLEEVVHLSEQDLSPTDYYGEFLKRLLMALAAPAGAVWIQTPQGHLQLQYQINMRQVGLDQSEEARQMHNELLREAFQSGRAIHLPPHSGGGAADGGGTAPGNPTGYLVLLAPILVEKQAVGLVEVWQSPNYQSNAVPGFMQFVVRMAELASLYTRNNRLRQMVGQQQVWTQLEAFARQVHNSLNPTEVAYVVANEGRRLVECDRISVAVRRGRKTRVEAISGADVVERRSNLVKLMRRLFDRNLVWGEKLVYTGTKDESLPPDILAALDAFLAESNSKLLTILPLRDEREKDSPKPPRSALLMECFEPSGAPEQLTARLEVVGQHAASALYNASEYRRIPLRFLWMPLAWVRDGMGGTARTIVASVALALIALVALLVFVPYPLKMDANGHLLPEDRRWVFSPVAGEVVEFEVGPGDQVVEGQSLVLMRDVDLAMNLEKLNGDINKAVREIELFNSQLNQGSGLKAEERRKLTADRRSKETELGTNLRRLTLLTQRVHADEARLGYFWLKAPMTGTVLNYDFREQLLNRTVKPTDQLLRIGDKTKRWEAELKIPQKHLGQVLHAFALIPPDQELDVDLLVLSAPTRVFKGKLARNKISGQAEPRKDDASETEPVVFASVRVAGDDIPEDEQIPPEHLYTGTEVHAKIRCGNRAMGYSLFYGMWEFFYEKVVFWF